MDRLEYRYNLVNNDEYKKLRAEYLNVIVSKATAPLSADVIRGMLLLINESDQWERNYLSACEKARKNKE